jgi:hypothetical protein
MPLVHLDKERVEFIAKKLEGRWRVVVEKEIYD